MNENSKPKLLKLALYLLSVVVMILIMVLANYSLVPLIATSLVLIA